MSIREDYKKKFAEERANNSIHPLEFWLGIVDVLFENRTLKKLDLFTPLGHWLNDWDAFNLLSQINGKGMEAEKEKGIEEAFGFYEILIAEAFIGTHPYDRLRIWYTKNKNYKDAMRVCQTYLELPDRPHGQAKEDFQHHLIKLKAKLDKLKIEA
jgi:hypothetical protein